MADALYVLPGYQRMKALQRRRLLELWEAGLVSSPVTVTAVSRGSYRVVDHHNNDFVISPSGEVYSAT